MPFNSPRAMLAVSKLYVSCKRINAAAAPFKSSSDGNFIKFRCIVTFSTISIEHPHNVKNRMEIKEEIEEKMFSNE